MDKLNTIQPAMVRLDASRYSNYLYKPEPMGFWKKIGIGLGKAVSFLGPVGAGIMAVVAPPLLPASLAILGGSKLVNKATNNALSAEEARTAEYQAEMAEKEIGVPGFFDAYPSDAQITTDFIAPSEFGPSIERVGNDQMESIYSTTQTIE